MREVLLRVSATMGLVLISLNTSSVSWAEHTWGNFHWERSSNPVSIGLGDNVDSRWDKWLIEARQDWGASSVLNTSIVSGNAKGNCRPSDGQVEVCNDNYGYSGWLGIAQIWASGDHITKAAVKVNDSYHDFAPYNQDGWRDLVMCQEVGHIFGLGHQDENFDNGNLGTCMDYTSNPGGPPSNRQPNPHDYAVLDDLYRHQDGSATEESGPKDCKGPAWKCGGAEPPPPAFDMELTGVGQWGRLISVSRDGGQSLFVQDFGRGYRVYTHVTWTLEVANRLAASRR